MKYSFKMIVTEDAIDELNHVNNISYLNWVQLAAKKHWSELSKNKFDQKFAWVVLRHEIDYLSPAYLNDELTIKTWVGETGGVKSVRHVEIFKFDKLLVRAKTTWCLVDLNLNKPLRITDELLNILKKDKLKNDN